MFRAEVNPKQSRKKVLLYCPDDTHAGCLSERSKKDFFAVDDGNPCRKKQYDSRKLPAHQKTSKPIFVLNNKREELVLFNTIVYLVFTWR